MERRCSWPIAGFNNRPSSAESRRHDPDGARLVPATLQPRRAGELCRRCTLESTCHQRAPRGEHGADTSAPMRRAGSYRAGDYIFRAGDAFNCIAVVRKGCVKTLVNDSEGNEQILAFSFPGDVLGLGGFHSLTYPCSSIALESVQVCRIPYSEIRAGTERSSALQYRLLGALSEQIERVAMMAANSRTEERMASFLADLLLRQLRSGYSSQRLQLRMSRVEIANHLRMAPETASRALKRLVLDGVIGVRSRQVEVLDSGRLLSRAALCG